MSERHGAGSMGLMDDIRRFAGASLAVAMASLCLTACSPAASGSSRDGASSAQEKTGSSPSVHTAAEIEAILAELESGQKPELETPLTERPDGKAISEGLPFKDMDTSLIDQTWLGVHDEKGEIISGGSLFSGGTPFYWRAQNGTDDLVFEAIVRDGRVIKVSKFNQGRNYWAVPGQILGRDLPDRTASGAMVEKGSLDVVPDDPTDYASPKEYADNNETAFASNGASDPWQSAYDYWCGNAA